jgi:hypothetical protein
MRTLNLLLYNLTRAAKHEGRRDGGVEGGFPLGNQDKRRRGGSRARRIGYFGEKPGSEAVTQMNLLSPRMMTMNLACRKMGAMTVTPRIMKKATHSKRW